MLSVSVTVFVSGASTCAVAGHTLPSWFRPVRRWHCCQKHTPPRQSYDPAYFRYPLTVSFFRAATPAVAHAPYRLGAVLSAGGVVVGNILLPIKAMVQSRDFLVFCVEEECLCRCKSLIRFSVQVAGFVTLPLSHAWSPVGFVIVLLGVPVTSTAGRVIFDFPAGVQRANIRLDLCAVHRTVFWSRTPPLPIPAPARHRLSCRPRFNFASPETVMSPLLRALRPPPMPPAPASGGT